MSSFKSFLRQNPGTVVLVCALSASLGLNVYQALKMRGAFMPATGIRVGTEIPPILPLLDQDGKPVALDFRKDSRPTVLYVLSPLCGWCKRNEANMKILAAEASSRFRFVGLSIESKNLKEYIAQNHAPFPVYLVTKEQIDKLHLDGTPQTVVVAATGKIEKSWQGAYLHSNQNEVEKFFGVKLPGLQETPAVVR